MKPTFMRRPAKPKDRERRSGRLSLLVLGLAGLGVGVWLFRSKRRRAARQG